MPPVAPEHRAAVLGTVLEAPATPPRIRKVLHFCAVCVICKTGSESEPSIAARAAPRHAGSTGRADAPVALEHHAAVLGTVLEAPAMPLRIRKVLPQSIQLPHFACMAHAARHVLHALHHAPQPAQAALSPPVAPEHRAAAPGTVLETPAMPPRSCKVQACRCDTRGPRLSSAQSWLISNNPCTARSTAPRLLAARHQAAGAAETCTRSRNCTPAPELSPAVLHRPAETTALPRCCVPVLPLLPLPPAAASSPGSWYEQRGL